jgi:hypothetical protein
MSVKGSVVQDETQVDGLHHPETNGSNAVNTAEKPRGRRRFVLFLKKWWWLLLIIFVIGFLVISLPLYVHNRLHAMIKLNVCLTLSRFLVGIPRIIQQKVNDSVLTIQGIRVTHPTPTSAFTEINSTITQDSSISATIDGFNASLYLEDKLPHTPFAYIQMPGINVESVVAINTSQTIEIVDVQAYADYNAWYLLNESFRMTVSGQTYVHVKGLRAAPITFEKTVTLAGKSRASLQRTRDFPLICAWLGLNGFKGLDVTSSEVKIVPDAQGDNFFGYSTIPNPSVLTVELVSLCHSSPVLHCWSM